MTSRYIVHTLMLASGERLPVLVDREAGEPLFEPTVYTVTDPRFDTSFKPMGNCGSYSFCGFAAPITCYTCRNFQPWLDGPHEAVLAHLISERARLKVSADLRIASVNDRTILAVAQVITQCQQMRDDNCCRSHALHPTHRTDTPTHRH